MEVALLARGFALLVAVLVDENVLDVDDTDPGRAEMAKEIRAIAQTYGERARAQALYHTTRRGELALERAAAADAAEEN
jgi:hypothetical protein